jgi:hypothetical protein
LFRHRFRANRTNPDAAPDNGIDRQINGIKKYLSKLSQVLKQRLWRNLTRFHPSAIKGGSGIYYTKSPELLI